MNFEITSIDLSKGVMLADIEKYNNSDRRYFKMQSLDFKDFFEI